MIVVVGGNRPKAGKTTVVCRIIAATPEARWTAIKLTVDQHEPTTHGDTERYLAAGAMRAILTNEIGTIAGNIIIESNSILRKLKPDLFVFVDDGGEPKPSAIEHASKADIIVRDLDCEDVVNRVRDMLSGRRD